MATVLDRLNGLNNSNNVSVERDNFQQEAQTFFEETEAFFEDNSIILNDIEEESDTPPVSLNVTAFEDQNDGSLVNGLSLRDAILRAQSDRQNQYIIFLPAGTYNLSIQGNQDSLFEDDPNFPLNIDDIVTRTGDLDINSRITIVGAGVSETIIDASNLGDRIFDVRFGGNLTLENVTIQGGTATNTTVEEVSYTGGGIRVDENSTAIVNNSVIRDNSIEVDPGLNNPNGGGIANFGVMEINNTIVSENLSQDDGGGIYNTGTMNITGSTIAGNFANAAAVEVIEAGGGGIYNAAGGDLLVRNSTISGNITGDGGGGILSESTNTVIINTTIADNSAQIGSGILSSIILADQEENTQIEDGVILQNSIVARNIDSADIEGFFAENSSNNLIGNANGILLNGVNGNIVGDVLSPLDPRLSPLQDNGGPTPTYALLDGSPAINSGDNNLTAPEDSDAPPLTTDQRGSERISGGIVDIGSYELLTSANFASANFSSLNSSLNTPINRFQNTSIPGTYLYTGEQESQNIRANNPEFVDEGFAFNVGIAPGDDLIPMYRFQNTSIPGTYLYAGETESQNIRQNFSNFKEEGIAFYVYGADANRGVDIYRFQNSQLPGTYLFVGQEERQNILQNNPNFVEEGVAFEAG
jgi:hypothetical protein